MSTMSDSSSAREARSRAMSQTMNATMMRLWTLTAGLAVAVSLTGGAASQKFYADDPISKMVESQDASNVQERGIDLLYDTLENSFYWPGDQTPDVRAQNVNTVDEVVDSNWFTNRIGTKALAVEQLLKGPDTTDGPAGQWTVIAAKNDGVTPGFTVRDGNGQVWFLKFDPPGTARWPPAPRWSSPNSSGLSVITCRKCTSPCCNRSS